MNVTPSGGRMIYLVQSESNPRSVHVVDLLEHEGRGACSCKDWQTRRWPVIRDGGSAACKHVNAAREYFLTNLLRDMALREVEPKKRA